MASVETLIALQKKENLRPMPRIVSSPMSYVPEDVRNLGQMLTREIQRISDIRGIKNYPNDERQFQGKVPADVFGKHLDVFIKLRLLADIEEISPNEVYSQFVRATSDVKSVMTQIDPAQRFRIDAPKASPADIKPAHTFEVCLQIRREINMLRQNFGLLPVPLPELAKDDDIRPADVFIQSMIIIAELNLLKMATGTVSSTPLAIPVFGKTPADTYQQAVMVKYLLSQVRPVQDMMKQLGK
ncbi:MAG: hypothetical protein HC887_12320 [Desulfobacteraceae bacterium]|nr:hypothetical protein [Desulfobacteraceae bacterium]